MNRDNRDRNPFQRQNRRNDYPRADSSGGYGAWKNRTAGPPQPPKEKVLTADDFPALASSSAPKPKTAWSAPETTIADRVKDAIVKEEERKERGRLEAEVESEHGELYVIPISSWIRNSYLVKRQAEERKRREAEEEEANYRWQISKDIVRRNSQEDLEREFQRLARRDRDDAEEEDLDAEDAEYEERR